VEIGEEDKIRSFDEQVLAAFQGRRRFRGKLERGTSPGIEEKSETERSG